MELIKINKIELTEGFMEGKWLSVLEFAAYKKKSISTVRRYIKAGRVKFKEDNGKYYIWTKNFIPEQTAQEKEVLTIKLENQRLKKELIELKEELAEKQMLIDLYQSGQLKEERKLPDLPAII